MKKREKAWFFLKDHYFKAQRGFKSIFCTARCMNQNTKIKRLILKIALVTPHEVSMEKSEIEGRSCEKFGR